LASLVLISLWGLKDSPDCICGKPQTAQHIINYRAVFGPPKEPCIPQWSNIALA